MKTLLGGSLDGEFDDLDPAGQKHASAEAALDEAIRQRLGGAAADRRDGNQPDRRLAASSTLTGAVERRGPVPDRRSPPQGFGRRGRPV